MSDKIIVSPLDHTWLIDIDGTIVKHNGYKLDGYDTLLDGAKKFLDSIPKEDKIIFLTSRTNEYQQITETFLQSNKIKYDGILFGLPYGERILINDSKPSGLKTGISIEKKRDANWFPEIIIDNDL